MKLFIFNHVEQLTDNYHCDGGLVVIANDLDEVKKMVGSERDFRDTEITDEEYSKVIIYDLADNVPKDYFIFPNAGCC